VTQAEHQQGQAGTESAGLWAADERARHALLAHLRHNLRSPLNAILGYAEMLIEDAEAEGQPDLLPDLQRIHAAGTELVSRVGEVLDPARFEAVPTDPPAFEAALRHELRTPLNAVLGYSEMLLDDARDRGLDGYVPDLDRIHTAGRQFLALVDDVVRFSTAQMAEGQGAVETLAPTVETGFLVQETLRAIPALAEDASAESTAVRGSILVVDDSETNRDLLARALERQGHTVALAETGQQALEMLEAQPCDLVLLDIMMPGMSGYQVLQRLKGHPTWRDIPVIVISALDEMDSIVRCIELGAEDYLPKPFNPVLLQARTQASLDKKRLRDRELEYLEQVNRVVDAAQAVQAATFDPATLDPVAARDDALGQLAHVFQHMAREVVLREQRLKRHLEQLRLDVDEMRRAQAERMTVYLPMDRRHALVRNETLPDRTEGTALCADISGFTPLTAALAQELGLKRGAEVLTRHLNRVYGALIAEVHRYGSSVLNFSGDAILCWFDRDAGLRAVACGLAMQNAMAQFASVTTPTGTAFSLAIKVAVVRGPARRFLVGDPQQRTIEVLAGRTVDELARAEHCANPGQVIAQSEIADAAGGQVTVDGWRTEPETGQRLAIVSGLTGPPPVAPWPELPADALTDEQCRPWLLPAVYRRMSSGTQQFLAELRPAATLFLSFQGLDYDGDADAGVKLDAYVRWVQTVLERYDGSLIKITMGDKGRYLHAVFGAPVAHHDDEVRAVSAALALQMPPPELAYVSGFRIGVTRGQMRVGTYGGPTRCTYGMQGDSINLAARLMQAATHVCADGGGILCDEAIYQAARARLVFEALPPIHVKGKEEAIAIYRPTGEKRHSPRSPARLIGRSGERVRLRESLEAHLHGASPLVIVEGEAGIGKSRLVDEQRQQAEAMGMSTLTLAGDAAAKSTAYAAWRGPLQTLLRLDREAGQEVRDRLVTVLLQDHAEQGQLAPLLNPVLSLALPESELTASMNEQARIDGARALLVNLLRDCLRPPARAIFVENGQDLDPASWRLILAARQRIDPLLLVIATRPLAEPRPTGYAQLQQEGYVQTLSLKALSQEETYLLACEHLGVVSLPEPLKALLQRAGGNPLVIEELVYQLLDEGTLTIDEGRCHIATGVDLRGFVIPTTAQGVLISRVDRLSPSEQLTLKIASVIGRTFSRRLLHDLLPAASGRIHLDRHLETLEQLDLIAQEAPRPVYTFNSPLIQETAYNALLYSQRRQLHRQVAEWVERVYAADLTPHLATLAHHWRQADEPARAIPYLEQASQQARASGAYGDAERYLKESLELEAAAGVLSADYPGQGLPHGEGENPRPTGPDTNNGE
jgi:CheY-like chemotaxis protein